ncbi:helix-turn-helix domain-containing protein [Paracoccus salsus]|uniref:helix-turn-helix domain-containing protein n=1 Tax=Paracoccus salsus TaxID=2911061 RepID=UPI001F31A86C|nr:helix-turn-helix transcriptional regulator [Paracoccus salsus]MCF3972106.1 helix-turn-helix domain-containing protein [Paracoccus salsus]
MSREDNGKDKTDFHVLLEAALLTQREAADLLGVAHDTVRGWVKGRRECPDGVLKELLGVAQKSLRDQANEVEEIASRVSRNDSG